MWLVDDCPGHYVVYGNRIPPSDQHKHQQGWCLCWSLGGMCGCVCVHIGHYVA